MNKNTDEEKERCRQEINNFLRKQDILKTHPGKEFSVWISTEDEDCEMIRNPRLPTCIFDYEFKLLKGETKDYTWKTYSFGDTGGQNHDYNYLDITRKTPSGIGD